MLAPAIIRSAALHYDPIGIQSDVFDSISSSQDMRAAHLHGKRLSDVVNVVPLARTNPCFHLCPKE